MANALGIIEQTIESKLCLIEDTVSQFDIPCALASIANATSISLKGPYCLTHSINGTITINADDVYLDLNGYRVNGNIVIQPGQKNIVIRNGFISNGKSDTGICIEGTVMATIENVLIENIALDACTTGISALETVGLTIQSVHIDDCSMGITATDSSGIVISNTSIQNQENAIVLNTCSDVAIDACTASMITNDIFSITDGACIILNQCQAYMSTSGNGFSLEGNRISCQNCIALHCVSGFSSINTGVRGLNISNSLAQNNTIGFDMVNTKTGVIKENVALNNTVGFSDASTGVVYLANSAIGNGMNYSTAGIPFSPVSALTATSYWQNITG